MQPNALPSPLHINSRVVKQWVETNPEQFVESVKLYRMVGGISLWYYVINQVMTQCQTNSSVLCDKGSVWAVCVPAVARPTTSAHSAQQKQATIIAQATASGRQARTTSDDEGRPSPSSWYPGAAHWPQLAPGCLGRNIRGFHSTYEASTWKQNARWDSTIEKIFETVGSCYCTQRSVSTCKWFDTIRYAWHQN